MSKLLLWIFEVILVASGMFSAAIILPLFLFRLLGILLGAY